MLSCIILITFLGYSQSDSISSDKKSFAKEQLLTLKKEGAVIVLLKGTTRAMEAYEKAGKIEIVTEMNKKIEKTNFSLIHAFRTYWKFSPVYFMINDDLSAFQKNINANVFVDSLQKPIPLQALTQSYHVFMDFGSYYVPSENTSDSKPTKWDKKHPHKIADPTESNQVLEECLVVKDKDLNQFLSPYPNRSASIMGSRDLDNLVAALNRHFFAFLEDN